MVLRRVVAFGLFLPLSGCLWFRDRDRDDDPVDPGDYCNPVLTDPGPQPIRCGPVPALSYLQAVGDYYGITVSWMAPRGFQEYYAVDIFRNEDLSAPGCSGDLIGTNVRGSGRGGGGNLKDWDAETDVTYAYSARISSVSSTHFDPPPGPCSPISVTKKHPSPFSPPVGPRAVEQADGSVLLSWSFRPAPTPLPTAVRVYRTAPGFDGDCTDLPFLVQAPVAQPQASDTPPEPGEHEYWFASITMSAVGPTFSACVGPVLLNYAACGLATTCDDCVRRYECGMCGTRCRPGTDTGPTTGTCTSSWAFSPDECS